LTDKHHKQYIRQEVWLPACKEHKENLERHWETNPLRYFTFCAAEAIDVFLLEKEGVLRRSQKTGRLDGVFFCEENDQDFGRIATLIGSQAQGFRGRFDKIVLFEDDDETRGKSLYEDDDEPNPNDPKITPEEQVRLAELRKKLEYKDAHERFCNAFPLDIINLDVFGVMFPLRVGVISPLVKSLLKVLELQTNSVDRKGRPIKKFTLLLTTHIDPSVTDAGAISELEYRLNNNITHHGNFANEFEKRFGHNQAARLKAENFAEFFCLALPKLIINAALFDMGWKVNYKQSYLYDRPDKYVPDKNYQMMHSVSVFERLPASPGFGAQSRADEYVRSIMSVVRGDIVSVEELIADPTLIASLQESWDQIVAFRDQY
jgi:hypothetical protein